MNPKYNIKIKNWLSRLPFERTIEDADGTLKRFLIRGKDACVRGVEDARIRLLKICCQEKEPHKRWRRASDFLSENIKTQLPLTEAMSHQLRKKIQKMRGQKTSASHNTYQPWYALVHILDNTSYIHECVKLVSLLNFSTGQERFTPKNVKLFVSREDDFNHWNFRHTLMRIHVQLKKSRKNVGRCSGKNL